MSAPETNVARRHDPCVAAADRGPVRLDRRRYARARGGVGLPPSPPEIAEIETAVKAVQARGLDIADIAARTSRCRCSGWCWTGCAPRCSTAAALCYCEDARRRSADRRERDRLLGYRHLFRQCPIAERARHLLGMSTTSVKGSARPTQISAAMRLRNARISISTAATSSRCCACGARSQAGCRRSSVR